jgi:hypothetical protein
VRSGPDTVYDGRGDFSLAKYWKKEYIEEVKPGSAVILIFTVRRGMLPDEANWLKAPKNMAAVHLNLLAVIVLAEPSNAV